MTPARTLPLLAALLHLATAWRYGYFRDELYFIACAKHLAWGYVDQPPLVALAAWLSAPAAYDLVALRILPAIAAGATVYVAIALARELGGGRYAQTVTGIATMLLPAYVLLGNVLTTTSFEPLSWTLTLYATVRIVRAPPQKAAAWWTLLAGALVFGAYGKYSIGLLAAALLAGVLVTPQRRILASARPWAVAGAVVLLLLPNLGWQAAHGWPFVDVLRGDAAHRPAFQSGAALEFTDFARNAAAFVLEQAIYTNVVAVPLWIAGIVAPFRVQAFRDLRFIPIGYALVVVVAVALDAKGYYAIGIYAALIALGAVALERAAAVWRIALPAALLLTAAIALPFSLPVLPVEGLIAYSQALGITGRGGTTPHLMQPIFAEEFGWERLARDVAGVYRSLPPRVRAKTAVYADTYGDAGALDFYGPRFGLPPAISSQNSYYLWGTRGYDGSTMVAVGATRIALLRAFYRHVTLVRTSSEPYKWIVEGPAPIYVCRDPIAPLTTIWPHLRWYGA